MEVHTAPAVLRTRRRRACGTDFAVSGIGSGNRTAVLLVAQLRLYFAYACNERVGSESVLRCLPLEAIELIGQQMTVYVALHGLVSRPALLNEGVPPGCGLRGAPPH